MNPVIRLIADRLGLMGNEPGYTPVLCPLHDDTKNSAAINWQKKHFICWAGCGDNFTLYDLYSQMFTDDERDGHDIQTDEIISLTFDDENDEQDEIDDIESIFEQQAETNSSNQAEIILTDEEITTSLKDFFSSRKITKEIYRQFNAQVILDKADPHYGYIKFPHDTHEGEFIARLVLPLNKPRYLNSPGKKHLYGLSTIEPGKDVIILEGIFNYLTLKQLGFNNVLCSQGSKLPCEMAFDLRHKVSTAFMLFDNDWPGFSGAIKGCTNLAFIGVNGIQLEMPSHFGNDANEALQGDFGEELTKWILQEVGKFDTSDVHFVEQTFNSQTPALKMVSSGLADFDQLLGGGLKEGVHGLAGKPGVGKSALAINLTGNMAYKLGVRVLYCTYEISKLQIWARYASIFDGHSWPEIEVNPGLVSDKTKEKLTKLATLIKVVSGWTIAEIVRASPNFDVLAIDYIQRMPAMKADAGLNQTVSENIERLSNLARDDKKIIIALSSLNRMFYEKNEMAGMKESGSIEYVMQSMTKINPEKDGLLSCHLLKNTRGQKGSFWLMPDLAHNNFESTSPRSADGSIDFETIISQTKGL